MAKKAKTHPLDALVTDPHKVIAFMLWKARFQQPDLYVQIDEGDLEKFEACMQYQKVTPTVSVKRPAGIPAQAAIPASHGRRAVPGREATPPRPYVIAALVDKRTGDAIRPVENDEEDFDRQKDTAAVMRARDRAQDLAQRLVSQGRTGETSQSDMNDAAEALLTLARAVR